MRPKAAWTGAKKLSRTASFFMAVALAVPCSPLTVGSKKFTESFVLGELATQSLRSSGFPALHKQGMGGTIILWQALKGGSIDAYPEYTGTIGEEILKSKSRMSLGEMRAELGRQGIGMTDPLGFNNTYALVMKRALARRLGVSKISDLRAHEDLACGPTIEFLGRKDGWGPLMARYGIQMASVKGIEHNLGYAALESGGIAVKDAYSTDAAIAEHDLVVLQDDLGFFPEYKAVFLYRLAVPAPAVKVLQSLAGRIDDGTMVRLNAEAERTKDYTATAANFLSRSSGAKPSGGTATPRQDVWHELLTEAGQHLVLVGVSLALAVLVGVPLGVCASRPGPASALILGATGLLQTVPSLALFALLVPWLGTEPRTAILALFLYSLLPIVRNTATGLASIPPALKESAVALGLEPRARLMKVELPLASATILAGIKVSAIINVGTATIAAFIGAGGLGQSIQTGLALSDTDLIVRGGLAAAALALLVQIFFDLLDRALIPKGLRLKAS